MSFKLEPRTDLIWIAVDLDGTLAEPVWPDPGIGHPIQENVAKARKLEGEGYKIIIHTSRGWEDYEMIEAWLRKFGIPFNRIVCGKLLAHRYVDDKAIHSEADSWLPKDEPPSQKERLVALLEDFGLTPEITSEGVSLVAQKGNVQGYSGFACEFDFDELGCFQDAYVWE